MIVNAELIYRQPLQVTEEPPQIHPRLYGSNDHWLSHRAQPFYLTPCSVGERNVGWFRAAGVADVKAHFEISARGFQYCYEAAKDGGDIAGYGPAKSYLEFEASRDSTPSYTNGLKVLHLVRRLWACAESNSGSYASCEYNEKTETERVARSLVAVDLHRLWNGNNWTPNLCIAVMAWLISFWHEEPETAYEVLARINDILWLHRDMFTSDGVCVEGVAMYSFMSITGIVGISAMQRASFGFAPHAIDANTVASIVKYHLKSFGQHVN